MGGRGSRADAAAHRNAGKPMSGVRVDTYATGGPLPICIGSALSGGLVLIIGLIFATQEVAMSYLVAYTATLATVLGMLMLMMIAHLSGAIWFVLFRRVAEAVVASLPMLAILTVPFVLAPRAFWPWAGSMSSPASPGHQVALWNAAYFDRDRKSVV